MTAAFACVCPACLFPPCPPPRAFGTCVHRVPPCACSPPVFPALSARRPVSAASCAPSSGPSSSPSTPAASLGGVGRRSAEDRRQHAAAVCVCRQLASTEAALTGAHARVTTLAQHSERARLQGARETPRLAKVVVPPPLPTPRLLSLSALSLSLISSSLTSSLLS